MTRSLHMRIKPWWIKERHNPQLGVYYVACGQMSKTAARRMETGTLYGENVMLRFETEHDYLAKIGELHNQGHNIHL